ncbi:MAG: peptidoglycan glycosyltransferase [Lachnospiraceae bacterium]|nr:peptidoglycan glycosyltransferase [Lachnospiraceae bacterium]
MKPYKRTIRRTINKKLTVVLVIIFAALLFLVGRIIYIQMVQGERYKRIVLNQQEYSSLTIPYKRGDIVDRNGTILATSMDVYNVILDCKVLNAKKDCIDVSVGALAKVFELDEKEIREKLNENKTSQYIVLKKKVSFEKVQEFNTYKETVDTNKAYVTGIWFEKEYIRMYPYGSLAANVIGFITAGNEGVTGLEKYYNDTLNGINGRQYGYLDSDNDFQKNIINPTDGHTLCTTLDLNVQMVVEQKIKAFNDSLSDGEYGLGSKNTAVIVMNPNSGEIYAMASYPSFDLNDPRDLSMYYSEEQIAEMSDDEVLNILNNLWNNFCVTSTYEPGSTAKPFTVAAGLDCGKLTGNENYYCDGVENVGGHKIRCVKREGHGWETIEQAINNSCNDALMQMSRVIGVDAFTKYQAIFGFGKKTNIDLPGEARTDSLIYTIDNMNAASLATNSFGQNFNVTMVQLAAGFSSLINGGNYYKPHILKECWTADGRAEEQLSSYLIRQTISEETSRYLRKYLYTTVQVGTGHSAKVEGYTMGGKTGTAEKLPRGNKKYLVSFIGFAPAANPKLLIYVIIDEPNLENQAQSSLATNLAKEIMTEILPYFNIYPDEDKEGSVPTLTPPEENYEDDIFGD